jgi:hypothetical protein
LLAQVAKRWLRGAGEQRRWIVNHALRSAVKRADAGALGALGYGGKAAVKLRRIDVPATARIGGTMRIGFEIHNPGRKVQRVMADMVVHFVKARGTGAKTFKLKALTLKPGESVAVGKSIALKQLTTRKHYPGRHRIDALLNGQRLPLGSFLLKR